MKADHQLISESYSRNVLRENVDRLEFLKNKYLPVFYNKLLHIWPDESNLPSDYNIFKNKVEMNEKFKAYETFLSETIDNLISADPFSKVDMEKGAGYAGQYSDWILKTFLKTFDEKGEGSGKTLNHVKRFLNEDLYKLNSDLKIYDKNKTKVSLNKKNVRDINQIQDFQTLYYIIKPFIEKYEEEGVKDKTKVRTLLDNSQYFVGVPLTLSASQSLGINTRWCTAARSENNTYYNQYTKNGPLYVVFLKTKPEVKKFQFHFPSGQYMNSDDRPIDVFEFFSLHPYVGQAILQDYKRTEPKDEDLRKAELLTGGLGVLDKEPDQFFQNLSARNIITMIVQGQTDLERLNKGLKMVSDAFDNKATFDEDGLKITFARTDYDEFINDLYEGDHYNNLANAISRFAQNPVDTFFEGGEQDQLVPFVIDNILSPQQARGVRRVYSEIGETPEESGEFYNICKGVLHKTFRQSSELYRKNAILDLYKKRGIVFDKVGRKMVLTIPYDALLDVFKDGDTTTFFTLLENPSYHVRLHELIPVLNQEYIEDEQINFISYLTQNLDKNQVALDIIQKVNKK
jgi:hypothetical protein